jgi:hypothetical protein
MKSAPQMQAGALTNQNLNLPTPVPKKTLTKVTDVAYRPPANRRKFTGWSPESLSLALLSTSQLEVLTPPAKLARTF